MSGEIEGPQDYKTRVREALDVLENYVGDDGKINATKMTQEIKRLQAENAKLLARLDIQQDNEGGMHDEIDRLQTAVDCAQFDMEKARAENAELRALVGEMREDIMSWLKHSENTDAEAHRTPEEEHYSNELIFRADADLATDEPKDGRTA